MSGSDAGPRRCTSGWLQIRRHGASRGRSQLASGRVSHVSCSAGGFGIAAVKLSEKVSGRASVMGEFLVFLWERKLWWMIPMVTVLLLFGTLMILAQGTALSPFIYTLF